MRARTRVDKYKFDLFIILTDLIGSESGGHPRVFLQRASGIIVRVRVPLLRIASTHRGRHHRVMVVMAVVAVMRQVAAVMVNRSRRRVFATGSRGHSRGGRGCTLYGRGGGQQLLVTTERLVVTGWSRGQRRQRWRRRAPVNAGRRGRHNGRTTDATGRCLGDLPVVAATAAAAAGVVVVSWTVAVPAHLSENKRVKYTLLLLRK
jgi:hypothetical protein